MNGQLDHAPSVLRDLPDLKMLLKMRLKGSWKPIWLEARASLVIPETDLYAA